jgi:hypothetical protein
VAQFELQSFKIKSKCDTNSAMLALVITGKMKKVLFVFWFVLEAAKHCQLCTMPFVEF